MARGDRDGGVREHGAFGRGRNAVGLLVISAALLIGSLLLRAGAPPPSESVAQSPTPQAAPRTANAGQQEREAAMSTNTSKTAGGEAAVPTRIPKSRAGKLHALRRLGIEPTRDAEGRRHLDAAPVIDALRAAGIEDGIAAFPPPGTDPPKVGVIVPEGVELPEGYVRHHQSTDDGRPLEPILMFHPDYEFTDEQGQPIALPPDRIVPPDLVPPGIPVRMLEVPQHGE